MTDAIAPEPSAHPDHGALAASEHGLERSPHWPHVRKEQLRLHPACAATCLTEEIEGVELEAHHIYPFHLCVLVGRPDLELDLRNLITLTRSPVDPHLLLGHLDDFRSSNLDVAKDAEDFYERRTGNMLRPEDVDQVIKADPVWQGRHAARMRPWAEWDDQEKADFRAHLDEKFPKAVVVLPYPASAA